MLNTALVENADGKFLVLKNDALGQHLIRGDLWEPHFSKLVRAVVPPGSFAIDVGANIGYNTVVLAKTVGDSGRVTAFEPLRITFQQLCANVALNGLENVETLNVVIGNADSVMVSMVPVDYHEQNVNIMNTCVGIGGEQVLMRTLDSYNISGLGFLKIDVQGCEVAVLKGAEQTILTNRPLIFIEIEEPQLNNYNLSSQDVMFQLLSKNYTLVWNQSVSLVDWIAVPAEDRELLERVSQAMGPDSQVFNA